MIPAPRRLLAGLLMLCVLTSGCGDLRGERVVTGTATGNVEQPTPLATTAPVVGRSAAIEVRNIAGSEAFAFSSTELFGRQGVDGLALVNSGPTVITFVVPQCAICVQEGPEIANSAAGNPDVTYVVVHSGGTPDSYAEYVRSSGFTGDNVVHLDDSAGVLWARFGVVQQPTSVLVGADGSITQSLGALGANRLEQVITNLRA